MRYNAQLAGCGLKVANTDERANLNAAKNSQKAPAKYKKNKPVKGQCR